MHHCMLSWAQSPKATSNAQSPASNSSSDSVLVSTCKTFKVVHCSSADIPSTFYYYVTQPVYRGTSRDNQLKSFESKTTTVLLWPWVQRIKHIWNVVRRSLQPWFVHCEQIVTTCTKNNHCHHSLLAEVFRPLAKKGWEQLASELPLWWNWRPQ